MTTLRYNILKVSDTEIRISLFGMPASFGLEEAAQQSKNSLFVKKKAIVTTNHVHPSTSTTKISLIPNPKTV
jgi:hypothetical protein